MSTLQLALVLVASLWASVNTIIAGYSAVNGTRDRILTGKTDEGVPMSLEHRALSLRNDWVPLKLGLALLSLAFTAFLIFLPRLAEEASTLELICYLAALMPFFSFLGFFFLGLSDYRAMGEQLAGERQAAETPARARRKTAKRRRRKKRTKK